MVCVLGARTDAPTTSMATTSEGTSASTTIQAPISPIETTSESSEGKVIYQTK